MDGDRLARMVDHERVGCLVVESLERVIHTSIYWLQLVATVRRQSQHDDPVVFCKVNSFDRDIGVMVVKYKQHRMLVRTFG